MRYPISLSEKLEQVEEIHKSWNSSLKFEEVVNWILQFDSEDYDLAIRIVSNINFLNYGNIRSALSIAYSKLIRKAIEKGTKITHRNTLFAGLGDFGKSGSMMSYNFRVINELSEENFSENDNLIEEGNVENVVLIDDILSTGTQAAKEIEKLTEKVTPHGVKNIFLLTVCGMKEGIIKIEEETKAYTFSAFEYSSKDTVIDLDGKFYEGLTYKERESVYKRLENYGRIAYPKQPYGFGKIGGLIAFDFNTPNTSIPLIWSNANSWIPLFKRAKRINGIKSYYKQFEKKPKIKKEEPKEKTESTLSLFVEGKIEEIFFDILQKERAFANDLGVNVVNVIALGGTIASKRLVNQLSGLEGKKVFILEDDKHSKTIAKKFGSDIDIVYMEPNVMGFFRIKELLKDDKINKKVAESIHGKEITDFVFFELESLLMMRMSPSIRAKYLQEFIKKYLDTDKYKSFIAEVKKQIEKKEEKSAANNG